MERIHAVELEDLPWVPRAIRDGGTDLLDVLFAKARFYRALAPELIALLDQCGLRTVHDVCSGGGGGALAMRAELAAVNRADVSFALSDRYPNDAARARVAALSDDTLSYRAEPVDALEAAADPRAVRTMFGALHHFRPQEVTRILQSAVDSGAPIALVDVAASPTLRRLPTFVAPIAAVPNLAMLFLVALALVPFARPFRWSRVLLSYALPLIPALFAWDGTISALRAYTPEELLAMTRSLRGGDTYEWRAGRAQNALFLTGRPRAQS
jgi:hypothetical protein